MLSECRRLCQSARTDFETIQDRNPGSGLLRRFAPRNDDETSAPSLRAKRSNPGPRVLALDCFVALRAPRNDGQPHHALPLLPVKLVAIFCPGIKRTCHARETLRL